jgi:hypothetical protein
MARIIENLSGRRVIKLNVDDIFTIVSMYQQKCSSKCFTYEEARKVLDSGQYYLPEDI